MSCYKLLLVRPDRLPDDVPFDAGGVLIAHGYTPELALELWQEPGLATRSDATNDNLVAAL